jgi:hypothetical protein
MPSLWNSFLRTLPPFFGSRRENSLWAPSSVTFPMVRGAAFLLATPTWVKICAVIKIH